MIFPWKVGVAPILRPPTGCQLPAAAEALASVEETISALSYAEQAAGIRNRHRETSRVRVDLCWELYNLVKKNNTF